MLHEQTFEKLFTMKLFGIAEGLKDQMGRPYMDDLSFEDRFGMLIDAQWLWKENKRMKRLLKNAKLKLPASMEDIDYRTRDLDKSVMAHLGTCDWITRHQNVIIVGPTGTGKTFLSCALAHKACREGLSAFYVRTPKLYRALAIARADGSYGKTLARLAKMSVLILDDLVLTALTDPAPHPSMQQLFQAEYLRAPTRPSCGRWLGARIAAPAAPTSRSKRDAP